MTKTTGPIYEQIIEVHTRTRTSRISGKRAAKIHAAQSEVLRRAMNLLSVHDFGDPSPVKDSPYDFFLRACRKLKEAAAR